MSSKPTAKDLATLALVTLDRQQTFFRARSGSEEKSVSLRLAKSSEAELRKMAEAILAPPMLFDNQDYQD